MRVMVMKLDPDGLPRAWGIAPTEAAAREEADRQLQIYRVKKAEVGDPLAGAVFTEKVEAVE